MNVSDGNANEESKGNLAGRSTATNARLTADKSNDRLTANKAGAGSLEIDIESERDDNEGMMLLGDQGEDEPLG